MPLGNMLAQWHVAKWFAILEDGVSIGLQYGFRTLLDLVYGERIQAGNPPVEADRYGVSSQGSSPFRTSSGLAAVQI